MRENQGAPNVFVDARVHHWCCRNSIENLLDCLFQALAKTGTLLFVPGVRFLQILPGDMAEHDAHAHRFALLACSPALISSQLTTSSGLA